MNDMTSARIVAFLDAHHVLSLATSSQQGPHAVSVFYVRDEFALLWVSDPGSRHSVELVNDPRVAATIAPDCSDFADVRGVQFSGRAQRIADATERARARDLLESRYPFLRRISEGPLALREAYERVAFYRLEPDQITLIDNSRAFGHKDTLELKKS